jgi:hypothetical protein
MPRGPQKGCFDHRAKGTQKGAWLDPWATCKKIKGRKGTSGRHVGVVHPVDVQDRYGAFQLLCRVRRLFPFIESMLADGGYARRKIPATSLVLFLPCTMMPNECASLAVQMMRAHDPRFKGGAKNEYEKANFAVTINQTITFSL